MRNQLYVSVPTRNEIVIISTQTYEIVDRVIVGSRPQGIDLSLNDTLLFAALNGAGAVAYLDLESREVTEVVVGAELGDSRTYDVVEAKLNRVFVSADPGSSGFAYIVMIKRDEGNSAVRVADEQIIRAMPTFAKSPDGLRIYLGSGQVLRTGSFIQAGLIGSGVPKLTKDGSRAYVGREPDTIEIYDTTTFLKVDEFTIPCAFSQMQRIDLFPDESGLFILGDDIVCVVFLEGPPLLPPSIDITAIPNPAEVGGPLDLLLDLDNPGDAFNAKVKFYAIVRTVIPLRSVVVPLPEDFHIIDQPILSIPRLPVLPATIGFLSLLFNNDTGELLDWDVEVVGITTTPSAAEDLVLRQKAEEYIQETYGVDFKETLYRFIPTP